MNNLAMLGEFTYFARNTVIKANAKGEKKMDQSKKVSRRLRLGFVLDVNQEEARQASIDIILAH